VCRVVREDEAISVTGFVRLFVYLKCKVAVMLWILARFCPNAGLFFVHCTKNVLDPPIAAT